MKNESEIRKQARQLIRYSIYLEIRETLKLDDKQMQKMVDKASLRSVLSICQKSGLQHMYFEKLKNALIAGGIKLDLQVGRHLETIEEKIKKLENKKREIDKEIKKLKNEI
jgi:hypothetical protein